MQAKVFLNPFILCLNPPFPELFSYLRTSLKSRNMQFKSSQSDEVFKKCYNFYVIDFNLIATHKKTFYYYFYTILICYGIYNTRVFIIGLNIA
jgi:hypothetical protein